MDKMHILIVCPDGTNFAQLKQAGTLALALVASGLKVSLYIGKASGSALDELGTQISITYAPQRQDWRVWQSPLLDGFKTLLAKDTTIDAVHLIDVAWPASQLALHAARIRLAVVGRLWQTTDLKAENLGFWARRQHKQALGVLHPLIVHSTHLLDAAKKIGLTDVVLIPEGIDTERFKPVLSKRPIRRGLGLPEKATLVCCMADIAPENNQIAALEKCLPLNEKRQLLLIGNVVDKTYANDLLTLATQKGMGAYVHLIEAVPNPEDYLRACDLFILMGGIETRHATVLQAMSAGLPVVLAPAPSSLVLTNGNRCGVVLYDQNQLAENAFDKLLSDATYRQGRSMSTRPYVQKNFPFRAMVKAYMKIYNSL
jgi:glycosyltransferase involved in cell wall biosynthesis